MKLTTEQAYQALVKHGCFLTAACDKCGKLLAELRFTRKGEPGEWCSRECRDGEAAVAQREARRKRSAGRPKVYLSPAARQKAYREARRREFRNENGGTGLPHEEAKIASATGVESTGQEGIS